jgi:hypothetical protein
MKRWLSCRVQLWEAVQATTSVAKQSQKALLVMLTMVA